MALDVKHLKVSAIADGVDTDKVQPSDWNDSHDLSGFGGAAELNVGTVAGTVAAGDHVHNADEIVVVPSGSLISTDVQSALEELNSDLDAAVMTTSIGTHTIWIPGYSMSVYDGGDAYREHLEEVHGEFQIHNLVTFSEINPGFAQFAIAMPKSWDLGEIQAQFLWSHPATTTNFDVAWGIDGIAIIDGGALGGSSVNTVRVTDTGGETDHLYISDKTSPFTILGDVAQECYVHFEVMRLPSDASDNMAVPARLHGVRLYYTTNAATDD